MALERTNARNCLNEIMIHSPNEPPVFSDARRCSLFLYGLPKVIFPHFPLIPMRQVLFAAHGIEVGLLHVVDDLILDTLIVQLGQLRRAESINSAGVAHFLNDGLGGHAFPTQPDDFGDHNRRLALAKSDSSTATQCNKSGWHRCCEAVAPQNPFDGFNYLKEHLSYLERDAKNGFVVLDSSPL